MLIREDQEMDTMLLIEEGLAACTPIQRDRIRKYYLEGMTLEEIADGKDCKSISESIAAGLKKIKKLFDAYPQKQGL